MRQSPRRRALDPAQRAQLELDQEAARERLGATVDDRLRRILQFLETPFRKRPSGERLDWRVELGVFQDGRLAASHLKTHVGLHVGHEAPPGVTGVFHVTETDAEEVYRVLADRFARFKAGEPWAPMPRQALMASPNPDTGLVTIWRGGERPRTVVEATVTEVGRLLSLCQRLHVCLGCGEFFVAVRQARRHRGCKHRAANLKRKKGA